MTKSIRKIHNLTDIDQKGSKITEPNKGGVDPIIENSLLPPLS